MSAAEDPRRSVPRTDHVLNDPRVAQWREQVHGDIVVAAVREVLSSVRSGRLAPDEVIAAVDARLRERLPACGRC